MFLPRAVFSLNQCSQVWLLHPSGFLKRKRSCCMFMLVSLEKIQRVFKRAVKVFLLSGSCRAKSCPLDQMILTHPSLFSKTSPLFCILKITYCFEYYNKAKQLHFLRMHLYESFLKSVGLFWLKGLLFLFASKKPKSDHPFKSHFLKDFLRAVSF